MADTKLVQELGQVFPRMDCESWLMVNLSEKGYRECARKGQQGVEECHGRGGRTIAKLFDSRRRPGRWQDSKSLPPQRRGLDLWIPAPAFARVTFFRGKDGLGHIPLCGKTLQSS